MKNSKGFNPLRFILDWYGKVLVAREDREIKRWLNLMEIREAKYRLLKQKFTNTYDGGE